MLVVNTDMSSGYTRVKLGGIVINDRGEMTNRIYLIEGDEDCSYLCKMNFSDEESDYFIMCVETDFNKFPDLSEKEFIKNVQEAKPEEVIGKITKDTRVLYIDETGKLVALGEEAADSISTDFSLVTPEDEDFYDLLDETYALIIDATGKSGGIKNG